MLMEEYVTRVFDLFVEPIKEREKDVKRNCNYSRFHFIICARKWHSIASA